MSKKVEVKVKIKIDEEAIYSIIVSALEGGSGYWCMIDYEKSKVGEDVEFPHLDWFYNAGSYLTVVDTTTDKTYMVDRLKVLNALEPFFQKYPRLVTEVLHGDLDAGEADMFWQQVILGKVIYG